MRSSIKNKLQCSSLKVSFVYLISWILLFGCNESKTSKPNIIIILADDAGYADFGFMGSQDIQTPNLDALAGDGVIFTDAHVSASVCSPSRAGLLTGRYQQRFGHECNLEPNQPLAFDSAELTVAEFLRANGYKTSIFGKWHLGEELHQHPLNNGFDYFWGFLSGARSYFPVDQATIKPGHSILENFDQVEFEGYLTEVIGNEAVRYIDQQNDPFFMYLAFNAPHTPMHAKEEVVKMFGEDHKRPVYAAMLWSMDEAIGKVIASLKKKGVYENTMIFFLSDNGGAYNNHSSVEPLKGWKGNQFEGGIRVPFSVTWKGALDTGKFDGLTSSLDIFGTISDVVNPEYSFQKPLDGVNLIPFLTGQTERNPHEKLFWRKDETASIRAGDLKFISLKDSLKALYNLRVDLGEMNNLTTSNQSLSDSLFTELKSWEDELEDPIWKEPEGWNQVTRSIYEDLILGDPIRFKSPKDLDKKEPKNH